VEVLNQLNTYFSLVVPLALVGRQSDLGLVSRQLTRTISHITFFSLLIQQVVLDSGSHFSNSSGSHLFGLFGMNEIRDYLET
jgi:hypothetical protein